MAAKDLAFEEVDKLVNAFDFKTFQSGGKSFPGAAAATSPAAAIPNLCGVYKGVRPILALLVSTPLLPKKWRDGIQTLMGILDLLCPGQ